MFKKILAATVAITTLTYAPATFASQWVLVGSSSSASHQVFVDIDSIRGTGNTRTFWDNHIHSENQSLTGWLGSYRYYRSVKTLIFVDCVNIRIGTLAGAYYNWSGEVVYSFDESYLETPRNLSSVVPDSFGEAEFNYVCSRRTDVGTSNQFSSSSSTTSLNREQAVSLINQWLQAKQTIFAPPYSQDQVNTLTTGTLHRDLISANSPISWLINHNAYYRFGTQRVEAVNNFSSSSNHATIEVTITEESTLWINDQISSQQSNEDTFEVRYFLEVVNGRWKISDYRILN